MACGDSLHKLFSRERPAGINTTATKVMRKMVELDRNKVHPYILRFCDVLMDAACSMENEYLSYENKNVDVDAIRRQRKQTMKPRKIYGQILLNDLTQSLNKLKSLAEKHKKIRTELQAEVKFYREIQNKLLAKRLDLYKNNNSTTENMTTQQKRNKMENLRCMVAMYKFHGESADMIFKKVQRLQHRENEIFLKLKEAETDVLNKMKSRLNERLLDGLSDMQVIGFDPCVSPKSAERILGKVTELDKDFDDIINNIVTTGCNKYTFTSLQQRNNDRPSEDTINSACQSNSNSLYNEIDSCTDDTYSEQISDGITQNGTCNGTTYDKREDIELNVGNDDLILEKWTNLHTHSVDISVHLEEMHNDDSNVTVNGSSSSKCQVTESQNSIDEPVVIYTNHYVRIGEVTESENGNFLLTSKGRKIKQKVYHLDNISFGWFRSKPWSLKKRWGFFCPDDVICIN